MFPSTRASHVGIPLLTHAKIQLQSNLLAAALLAAQLAPVQPLEVAFAGTCGSMHGAEPRAKK